MNEARRTERLIASHTADSALGAPADETGGQYDWFWGVPAAFHALAAPHVDHPLPAAPTVSSDHAQRLGYWGALQYLLLRRLAWRSPASGLTWWYDQGKPLNDPTLALIARGWDHDGHLDAYLAWLLHRPLRFQLEAVPAVGWADEAPAAPARWSRWSEERAPNAPWFSGGWDPMHLTGHIGEAGRPDPEARLITVDPDRHRAVLLTSTMDAWYGDLMRLGGTLPQLKTDAWRVEVHVRPVGYLGTFRRSWETGLWFCGKHHVHSAGNQLHIAE